MEPPAQGAALVFERRAPVALLLLVLLAWPASVVVPIGAMSLAFAPPRAVTALVADLPGGTLAYTGTLIVVALAGCSIGPLASALLGRRFGRCEVRGDLLRPGSSSDAFYPLSDFALLRVTSRGLLLRRRGQARPWSWLSPPLVPTRDDLEQRRALAALRALDPDPAADDWRASLAPGAPAWVRACQVAPPLAAVAGFVLLAVRLRPGPDELKACLLLFFAVAFTGSRLFDWLAGQVHGHRLHAGREHLLLDGAKLLWADLTRVATDGEVLVAETAGRRRLVWLGAAEEPRARFLAVLAARLTPRRLEPTLPAWAAAPSRRRRAALGLVAALASLLLIVPLSLSTPDLPDETIVRDRLDNGARLVHKMGARGPSRLLYLVADGPWRALDEEFFPHDRIAAGGVFGALGEEEVARGRDVRRLTRDLRARRGRTPAPERRASDEPATLDLAARTGADPLGRPFSLPEGTTVLVLGEAGIETAAVPLPDALLQALSASADHVSSLHDVLEPALAPLARDQPAVARWLRGETSRRRVEVTDGAGWTLAWSVDHGQVMFVCVTPPAVAVAMVWAGSAHAPWQRRHGFVRQRGATVILEEEAERFVVLSPSGQVRPGLPTPSLDALHEATGRARAGASVAAALAALPPGWRAALGP